MSSDKTHGADLAMRLSSGKILDEHELVLSEKFFSEIFGSIPGIAAILNKYRQIIYANADFLNMLGLEGIQSILGNRPGEVLSCVNAWKKTGGCGTSEACEYCGALNAISECQETGMKVSREALIATRKGGKYQNLDLRIITTPVIIAGERLVSLYIQDISNEKRRQALEKIFLHDLLNTAGGLNGLLNILKNDGMGSDLNLLEMCEKASRDIIDEINLQRQLYSAEVGDLPVKTERINSAWIIQAAVRKTGSNVSVNDRKIIIPQDSADVELETDSSILQRVLMNLLKNALEATPRGGSVLIRADDMEGNVRFRVENETLIPKDIQMQLFQRSFSTKGSGRGLGTYSIMLLTENYLLGKVQFVSNETERTVFMIDLCKKYPGKLQVE